MVMLTKYLSDILHCNETRYFWVSWDDGLIEIGRGTVVGEDRIIGRLFENKLNIMSIGFSGWRNEGEWFFPNHHSEIYIWIILFKSTCIFCPFVVERYF